MQFTIDISITAHGGIINGLLACIGRDTYSLPTGGQRPFYAPSSFITKSKIGVLPVVIKGVRREQN